MYDLCQWKILYTIQAYFCYGANLLKHLDISTDHFEFVYNVVIHLRLHV